MPDLHMTCVDLWAEQAPRPGVEGAETYTAAEGWKHEEKYRAFKAAMEKFCRDRVTIYRMNTLDAAKMVADESLDFVFIDADHTYEGCKADIEAWTPKVKIGGMVAGHDYNFKWPGVQRAVMETGKHMVMSDSVWTRIRRE